MNKIKFLSLAAVAMAFTSCDMGNRDSYYDMTYKEANLIVNLNNSDQDASVSESSYKFKYIISKNVVDITATDVIINNQKISFETDTLTPVSKTFGEKVAYLGFSRSTNIGKGAKVTDFSGYVPYRYQVQPANLLSPNYKFEYGVEERLILNYVLNDDYKISTFKPLSTYVGTSHVSEESSTYSTKSTGYVVDIDFSKNKAKVYVLGMELVANPGTSEPKVMILEDVPVVFSHEGFKLEARAPKTTIPGTVDNKSEFVESDKYKVTDFFMTFLDPELVDVNFSYNVAGKRVSFMGCSIVKSIE